ncbi:MAG: protein kinase [Clostridiales bacterium]
MIDMEPFAGWIISKEIGKGTYSNVYLAEKNGMCSAIKQIIIPDNARYNIDYSRFRGNSQQIKNFYRPEIDKIMKEVSILSNLSGIPGIVIYQDHLVREYKLRSGWEILIKMEYLTPIDKYINKNGITIKEILKMGIDICYALEFCKNEGILHRDIKEGNILIDSRGKFKLCDFGISKTLKNSSSNLTIAGTYGYMAPEVQNGSNYDHRSDIYSLGIVIYKLLNNWSMPLTKNTSSSFIESLPKPAHGNDLIFKTVLKACEYKAEKRYTSFLEFKDKLLLLLNKTDNKILDLCVINVFHEKINMFIESENSFNSRFLYNSHNHDISNQKSVLKNSKQKINKSSNSKNELLLNNNSKKLSEIIYNLTHKKKSKIIILHSLIFLFIIFTIIFFKIILSEQINKHELFKSNETEAFDNTKINTDKIKLGDFIELGQYHNKPLLWKCSDLNSKGILLVSEYIVCLKAFDSAKKNKDTSNNKNIALYGSNNWHSSTIRAWLNSRSSKVDFSSNPPDTISVWNGYNPYDKEPGFLTNFNDKDISIIRETKINNNIDKVFILSKSEILSIFKNEEDRQRTPTKEAITLSTFKNENFKLNYTWWYWTRDKSKSDNYSVNFIDGDGSHNNFDNAYNGNFGILPAIYIDSPNINSGKGKSDNPFILGRIKK